MTMTTALGPLYYLADLGMLYFFVRLAIPTARHWRRLFSPRYARPHRLLGLVLFAYLVFGVADARFALLPRSSSYMWAYDAVLSLLGLAVAYTAATGFGPAHRKVKNDASGVLDESATVTESEMLEHCFYQGLNLVQVSYLHTLALWSGAEVGLTSRERTGLAFAATLPWMLRGMFPVNSFSANYSREGHGGTTPLIRLLYRLKKWQYLFYKHALLHGLNATMAASFDRSRDGLVFSDHFRLYWLCLNTAYVFEFYMQSLVKRGYLSQGAMLVCQQVLMGVSTVAAVDVLVASVRFVPAALSFVLNLLRRRRELSNMIAVLLVAGLGES